MSLRFSTKVFPAVVLGGVVVALVGCDSTTEFERCVYVEDPSAPNSPRQQDCAPSVFTAEDNRSREVSGVVWRGHEFVPGAFVRVDPWPGLTSTRSAVPVSTVTDSVGFFGGLRPVALRYDITAKLDNDHVIVIRGVAGRTIDPALESVPRTSPRGWTSRVEVELDAPLRDDRAIAFFANGEGVYRATGDLVNGLAVSTRDYAGTKATLHAVEYEKGKGLDTATAYGKLDVVVSAGAPRLAILHIEPITVFSEPSFTATPPPGWPMPKTVDIVIGFTPWNDAYLTTVALGAKKKIPIIPGAGYTYITSSSLDGARSDSGEVVFDAYAPVTKIVLPTPAEAQSPSSPDGTTPPSIALTDPLTATTKGVIEHVLTPDGAAGATVATAPTIRIITRQRDALVPDLAAMGSAPLRGQYTWSVRSYDSLRFVEELSGPYARRYYSMATTKPRSIVIR